MQHIKKCILLFVKLSITVIFLLWAFSRLEDPSLLFENFKLVLDTPIWIGIGISFAGASVFANALRLYILLKAQNINVDRIYMIRITLIGTFMALATFGTAAEDAYKMISLMRRNPEKKLIITMTTLVDHLIGFLSAGSIFLLFTWGTGIAGSVQHPAVKHALFAATIIQIIGFILIGCIALLSSHHLLEWSRKTLPRLMNHHYIRKISDSFNLFYARKHAVSIALIASFVLSSTHFLAWFAALKSVYPAAEITSFLSAIPIIDLISSLPLSLSGFGVRESAFEFFMGQLAHIPPPSAISASLVGFAFHAFWGVIGGILFLHTLWSTTKEK